MHKYMSICVHAYEFIHKYTHTQTCTCLCMQWVYVRMHVCMYGYLPHNEQGLIYDIQEMHSIKSVRTLSVVYG